MEDIYLVRRGGFLAPADDTAREAMARLQEGKPLRAKVTHARNYAFHKRAFALVKLGWSYWEPETMVSDIERQTCTLLSEYLIENGVDRDACYHLTHGFLQRLEAKRETLDADKSMEAFRNWVTIRAGFWHLQITPTGPRKVAQSWSFAHKDETAFQALYSAVFGVIWQQVLSRHFASPAEAENAANELMSFM